MRVEHIIINYYYCVMSVTAINLVSMLCLQSIEKIVALLDPEGNGKIHFKAFCQGVQQILQLKSKCSV